MPWPYISGTCWWKLTTPGLGRRCGNRRLPGQRLSQSTSHGHDSGLSDDGAPHDLCDQQPYRTAPSGYPFFVHDPQDGNPIDTVAFVINCDLSEHESVSALEASAIANIDADLRSDLPGSASGITFSALFTLMLPDWRRRLSARDRASGYYHWCQESGHGRFHHRPSAAVFTGSWNKK